METLDKSEKVKEIIISTNDPKTFCEAAAEFLEEIQALADNNDLVIQWFRIVISLLTINS